MEMGDHTVINIFQPPNELHYYLLLGYRLTSWSTRFAPNAGAPIIHSSTDGWALVVPLLPGTAGLIAPRPSAATHWFTRRWRTPACLTARLNPAGRTTTAIIVIAGVEASVVAPGKGGGGLAPSIVVVLWFTGT